MSKSLRDRISRGLSSVLVLLSSGGTFQISNNNVVRAMDRAENDQEEDSYYSDAEGPEQFVSSEGMGHKKNDIDKNNQVEDPFDEHEENIAKNKGEENRYDFDDSNLSKIEENNGSDIYKTDNELKSIISFEDNQKENHNLTDYELKTKLKLEGNERHKESCIKEEENIISLNINKDINESENNDEKKEERSKEMIEADQKQEENAEKSQKRATDSEKSDDEYEKEKSKKSYVEIIKTEGENDSNPFIKNMRKGLPSKTFLEDEEYMGRSFIKEKNKFKLSQVKKLREEGYRSESEKRIGIKKQIKLDKVKDTNKEKYEGNKKAELQSQKVGEGLGQDFDQNQYLIEEHPPAGGAEHNKWSTMKKCAVTASAILVLVVLGKGGYELYHYLSDNTDTEYDDDDDVDWDEWDYKL